MVVGTVEIGSKDKNQHENIALKLMVLLHTEVLSHCKLVETKRWQFRNKSRKKWMLWIKKCMFGKRRFGRTSKLYVVYHNVRRTMKLLVLGPIWKIWHKGLLSMVNRWSSDWNQRRNEKNGCRCSLLGCGQWKLFWGHKKRVPWRQTCETFRCITSRVRGIHCLKLLQKKVSFMHEYNGIRMWRRRLALKNRKWSNWWKPVDKRGKKTKKKYGGLSIGTYAEGKVKDRGLKRSGK